MGQVWWDRRPACHQPAPKKTHPHPLGCGWSLKPVLHSSKTARGCLPSYYHSSARANENAPGDMAERNRGSRLPPRAHADHARLRHCITPRRKPANRQTTHARVRDLSLRPPVGQSILSHCLRGPVQKPCRHLDDTAEIADCNYETRHLRPPISTFPMIPSTIGPASPDYRGICTKIVGSGVPSGVVILSLPLRIMCGNFICNARTSCDTPRLPYASSPNRPIVTALRSAP